MDRTHRFLRSAVVMGLVALVPLLAQAGLIHRYSFNDTGTNIVAAKDSAGSVDGKLHGAASIAQGKLTLKNDYEGTSADPKLAYLEFASPVLPKNGTSASVVVWFTAKDTGGFSRLFNFSDKEGGEGRAFFYFTPRTPDDQSRAGISATDTGGRVPIDNDRLDDGKPHVVAVVIDGQAKKMHVFIDGVEPKPAEDLGENTLDKVRPVDNFIGKSSFESDPGLSATIDEFRVYDAALGSKEIAAIIKAGPEALPPAEK